MWYVLTFVAGVFVGAVVSTIVYGLVSGKRTVRERWEDSDIEEGEDS